MSNGDRQEEPMEVTTDEVRVTLSIRWPEEDQPQKPKVELQRVLTTWANKGSFGAEFTVLKVSEDGMTAGIKIVPTPGLSELQKLVGQTLTSRDGKMVKIKSVNLTPPELEAQTAEDAAASCPPSSVPEPQHTQTPEDASIKLPPSLLPEPQDAKMQLVEQNSVGTSAAVSTAEEQAITCSVPVSQYWYMNNICREDIERIEKVHGVKLTAEVNVKFEADQKYGCPQNAHSEFVQLVLRSFNEIDSSVFPLMHLHPEELKDALKILQRKENKLLLTVSSQEMTICGPKQSLDDITKSLNVPQATLTDNHSSAGKSTWLSQDTPLDIDMSIKDPLLTSGLTMEESYWKLMTTSFNKQVVKIEDKFGVDLKESVISQGKVQVKAHYKRSGGNAAMESHAVRALLHLYQKAATSPMSFTPHLGATGFSDSPKNPTKVHSSEEASSGPLTRYNTRSTKPTGEGAPAGDNKDEDCPICIGPLTNRKQLKCKHEFCEVCLAKSEASMGPFCPVCRDVFGVMEGDQPPGDMTWYKTSHSLPGFSYCSTLVINYDIPPGKQTKKHPNPGVQYYGVSRKAYLPDNIEGREVLILLKKAFDQKLIFTVGTSRTTGMENQVTWNDIHHKTSMSGGPANFGYPDDDYLSRVKEELKAKGIV